MNEDIQKPKVIRNRSPEAKAFIRAQPRSMPAREVVDAARQAGHIFSTGLVHKVRERLRRIERESHRKAYHANKNGAANGHSNGHAKPGRGGAFVGRSSGARDAR